MNFQIECGTRTRYPDIVICTKRGFKSEALITSLEIYENNTFDCDKVFRGDPNVNEKPMPVRVAKMNIRNKVQLFV
jgi:hypothetical protein